jgi:very-short-patch-repair endonuclease
VTVGVELGFSKGRTTSGRIRKFVRGHNRRGSTHSDEVKQKLREFHYGKPLSEETKYAMSRSHKGKPQWSRGKTYEEMYGLKTDEILEKIKKGNTGKIRTKRIRKHYSRGRIEYLRTHKTKYTNTSIERKLKKELRRRKIPFRHQVKIGSFLVDFKIKGVPLAVEADGDYHHNLPNVMIKDAIRNKVVPKKLGGKLLIFLGSDINKDVKWCGRIIKRTYNELRS